MKKSFRAKKNKHFDPVNRMLTPDSHTKINWFPGHMNKAIKKIKERLKMVDIVLEIRDARSPMATGNASLRAVIGEKSKLILINKKNLADPKILKSWEKWFESKDEPYLFVNALDKNSLQEVIKKAKFLVNTKIKESNPDYKEKTKIRMMIIGLPNTGKSTIINRLANRNASKVADKPGQTQQQLWVTVNDEIEILDTPGVMTPDIKTNEQGLWLSAIHAIPDRIAGSDLIASFIVEYLIKNNRNALIERYNLEKEPTDLIETFNEIAKIRGCFLKKNEFDYDRVYKLIISDLRSGKLGLISFGTPPRIKSDPTV